ncbi:Mitochondrial presequence protease [Lithohypha guttulata]|nr:Mitochondrial presequence protease [Lithohypha guttulata]
MLRHVGQYGSPLHGVRPRCVGFLTPRSRVQRYASVTNIENFPALGEQLHGFTLKQKKHVPELHLTALQLEHDKTGAEYLHVAREDKNNVFAINFKTNPIDRTGLPHILEHVTLCGSEKFPVRDPFFKMMPRSLANFMNAFTSSDYTSYPFATTNAQDFRNLASVYLDATLHPLLKRTDFLQEGWRLGPEDPKEPATDENTIFKGVVYNEMKGQMSDASYLYYIRFREHLFPSLENSGGDPEKMTNLTHEQLVKFSREHYHPSNAKIFTYGNLPLADHLQQVDQALSQFSRAAKDADLKGPIDLADGPITYEVSGPLDTMQPAERQTKSSISWLGCQSSDIVENFSLSIMISLLMSGYGSPLYQGLIESGLGTNFSPNSGYDSSAKLSVVSIGLDGMKAEDAKGLRTTIQQILREKGSEAFQPHKVEGYMHQLEIALKHKTSRFGMGLLDKTMPGWFNGTSPMDGLAWNEIIDAFKARLAKGNLLESLMEKYLLNDKSLQFTMNPAESYNAELEAQEQQRRANILEVQTRAAGSSEAVFEQLGKQEMELLAEQEDAQHSNLETLPTLHVKDIPREKEKKSLRWDTIGQSRTLWRETDTNGITYFQARYLIDQLPGELRALMPLFTESLMRLGTKSMSVGDLEAEILLKTGGISVAPLLAPSPFSNTEYSEGLTFDGYALDRNMPAMLDLMRTILLEVDFDAPHATSAILELLESKTSGALDSVAEMGHHFAVSSAAAALSERAQKREQLSGLSQIEFSAKLLRSARADPQYLQELIGKLKLIQRIAVANSADLSMRVVCEPSSVSTNQGLIQKFTQRLPQAQTAPFAEYSSQPVPGSTFSRNTFFNMPFQVSYTGTCINTVPFGSPDKAPLTILSQLLTHNFLLREVREKGGAYGASASTGPSRSLFTMSSYRDPNPRNALNIFRKAGEFAQDRAWSDRELEESKLSVFQGIDAPTSVSSDGAKEFMYGITEEMDQQMREQLLSVNKDDIRRVAREYLVNAKEEDVSTAILGEKKSWVDEDKKYHVRGLNVSA